MIQVLEQGANGTSEIPKASNCNLPDHISASSLKNYLGCSLRYYFGKVLGLPQPASPSLHLGKAVHAGLERFHAGRWRGESHGSVTVIEAFRGAFNALEQDEPVQFKSGERDKLLQTGENVLKAYLESDHAALNEIPKGVEVRLEAEFEKLPTPLLGYVDLVRNGNVPVDFKTCAATPNIELEAFQHELQLTAYQILIEEATGEPVEGRELVFLVKTKTPKIIVHRLPPADADAKSRFWSLAQAAIDGIENERFYPQSGMHCSWCSFREECSQWKGVLSHD